MDVLAVLATEKNLPGSVVRRAEPGKQRKTGEQHTCPGGDKRGTEKRVATPGAAEPLRTVEQIGNERQPATSVAGRSSASMRLDI